MYIQAITVLNPLIAGRNPLIANLSLTYTQNMA